MARRVVIRAKDKEASSRQNSNAESTLDCDAMAILINAATEPNFGAILLNAAQRVAPIDEIYVFDTWAGTLPSLIASSSEISNQHIRAAEYAKRFYRFDSMTNLRLGTAPGRAIAARIDASQIKLGEYRRTCFDQPGICAKLSYGFHASEGWIVANFYSRKGSHEWCSTELTDIAHTTLSSILGAKRRALKPLTSIDEWQLLLSRVAPELTRREAEVCARTIAGQNAAQIADELGISRTSVLTYRQRSYRRYGLSGSNGFRSMLPR